MQFEHTAGRIEITHFETEPPSILTFSVLHSRRPVVTGVDQLSLSETNGEIDVRMHDFYLLDGDFEEWGTKLEYYMKRMAQQFFAAETTDFVRQAVTLAWTLAQNQEVIESDDVVSPESLADFEQERAPDRFRPAMGGHLHSCRPIVELEHILQSNSSPDYSPSALCQL